MEEVNEEVDEEDRRTPTSHVRPEILMWEVKNDEDLTSRGRPEIIMWDMMISGPPRLLERSEKG